MPCQKIPLGQEITGTPYNSQQECEQECCSTPEDCQNGECCSEKKCTPQQQCCPLGYFLCEDQTLGPCCPEFGPGQSACSPDNFGCVSTDPSCPGDDVGPCQTPT